MSQPKTASSPVPKKAPPPGERKSYSNSYRSLEAIWHVLRRFASKSHPLTVREIRDHLLDMAGPTPSAATLDRIFPQEHPLMDALFPGVTAEADGPAAVGAYFSSDALHVVLETPEGAVLADQDLAVEAEVHPFRVPSYSTIDKLLANGIPFDLETFPFRLRCVARVPGKRGRTVTVPYEDVEASFTSDEAAKNNNIPRRYYLANVLTEAEWRMFSGLVLVYPFLSERQTKKFLSALNQLRPKPVYVPDRFAFKRGDPRQTALIAKLDQAVMKKRKVRLEYGEYRLEMQEGAWKPVLRKRRRNGELDVSPYALMWSNGNYYLVVLHRGMMNLRVDRILSVELLDESFTIPEDFDLIRYRNSSPIMYPGTPHYVRMRCRAALLNTLLDFFGDLPSYSAPQTIDGGEFVDVSLSVATAGVKLFALQYAGSVEILEPESLRQEVIQALEAALTRYRG